MTAPIHSGVPLAPTKAKTSPRPTQSPRVEIPAILRRSTVETAKRQAHSTPLRPHRSHRTQKILRAMFFVGGLYRQAPALRLLRADTYIGGSSSPAKHRPYTSAQATQPPGGERPLLQRSKETLSSDKKFLPA